MVSEVGGWRVGVESPPMRGVGGGGSVADLVEVGSGVRGWG